MTKVTPWDEALLDAERAAMQSLKMDGLRVFEDMASSAVEAALVQLREHGYRLVPAEATEEMMDAARDANYPEAIYDPVINAATEAGDVLRGAK